MTVPAPYLTLPPANARAVVNLQAIVHNMQVLRARAPQAAQLAIVKANAYGHGLLPVSLAALQGGATWLGVAQLREALELRAALDTAGVARPSYRDAAGAAAYTPSSEVPGILTWIYPRRADLGAAVAAGLDLTASTTETLTAIMAGASAAGRAARVQLKIDTGLNRAGSTIAQWPELISQAARAQMRGEIVVTGVWSHFAQADDPAPLAVDFTRRQITRFETACQQAEAAGLGGFLRHISAASGALWYPEATYDLVRLGLAMYGVSPNSHRENAATIGLQPALTLQAELTAIKIASAGEQISYGGTWTAPQSTRLGLVPIGYGDGIPRRASGRAAVTITSTDFSLADGDEQPVSLGRFAQVGRICMDQFVIDLGPKPAEGDNLRPGQCVTLFGDPAWGGPQTPSLEEWAKAADTIGYEILTQIGASVPRIYIDGENQ